MNDKWKEDLISGAKEAKVGVVLKEELYLLVQEKDLTVSIYEFPKKEPLETGILTMMQAQEICKKRDPLIKFFSV